MTDKPDRIWTTGNDHTGSWNIDDVTHCPGTDYTRADIHDAVMAERDALANALRAMGVDPASIIAGEVKPDGEDWGEFIAELIKL